MSATQRGDANQYQSSANPPLSRLTNGALGKTDQTPQRDTRNIHPWSGLDEDFQYHPTLSKVPAGRPVSYSQASERESVQQPLTRSFSQRAREQRMARGGPQLDYLNNGEELVSGEGMPGNDGKRAVRQYPTASTSARPEKTPREFEARRSQHDPEPPGPQVDSRQSTPKASQHFSQSPQHSTEVKPLKPDLNPPSTQSNAATGPKATKTQNRDWAPHRSPLQTLEVKLNDISKEEKRARVQEAEMLLRESKTGRGGRMTSRETPTTSKKSPTLHQKPQEAEPEHEAGKDRGLTQRQRKGSHRNARIDPPHSGNRPLSGSERAQFADQDQERTAVESSRTDGTSDPLHEPDPRQRNSKNDGRVQPAAGAHHQIIPSNPRQRYPQSPTTAVQAPMWDGEAFGDATQRRPDESARRFEPRNQAPAEEGRRRASIRQVPAAQAIASNITRAVSLQQSQPQPVFREDQDPGRTGLMRDSNSSHRAALAEAANPSTQQDMGRKLQKVRPANTDRLSHPGRDEQKSFDAGATPTSAARGPSFPRADADTDDSKPQFYYRGMPKRADVDRPDPHRSREAGNSGLGETAVGVQQEETNRPRQASVAFKEPLDQSHPADEWKRAEVGRLTLGDLALDPADDHDQTWWETNDGSGRRKSRRSTGTPQAAADAYGQRDSARKMAFQPPLYLLCGPLLRYTGMRTERAEVQPGQMLGNIAHETWRGSVMIVTRDSYSSLQEAPTLRLFSQPRDLLPPPPEEVQGDELAPEYVDPIAGLTKVSRRGQTLYVKPVDHLEEGKDLSRIEDDTGLFETSPSPLDNSGHTSARPNSRTRGRDGEALGKYKVIRAARLYTDLKRDVTFWRFHIEVELGDQQAHIAYRINRGPPVGFWVPAKGQSMNIMFHSCNGFSLAANPDQFGGPDPLWRDVLNTHQTKPFHVMIGGGDQIYNDRVMIETQHFGAWTKLRTPREKSDAPFSDVMREELESYYLDRYAMWFSQGLFGLANSQIPMVNIYDDHDIIDGFGSYPDDFQKAPVFMGVGNIAFKYYMLFQHQSVPEETPKDEPSWILGAKPGPYIQQYSRSVFMHLGRGVAFLGVDCRTERERYSVLTDETYEIILERCRREIEEGETRHLLVLLGVPVAYPRLVWLENILTSRAMAPIKALSRTAVFKGGVLNKFDGGVEVLDDLDDHWTASGHKEERNLLIHDLQELAAEKSVRITILGGDVHLGAVGQFYSNPKFGIPKDRDHRYIPNVISSAIVNTPPPEMLADTLNKRNKIHYLDSYTAEDMIPMFSHDVDGKQRNNRCLLPRRNWCSIRAYHPGSTPPPTPPESRTPSDQMSESEDPPSPPNGGRRRFSISREDANPRNLLRRLSQRGAPPSSYRDQLNISSPIPARTAGQDGYFSGGYEPQTAPATRTSFPINQTGSQMPQTAPPHRTSFDQRASVDGVPSARAPRPEILRRPTNLSEKAAKKGGPPPSYDSQGNLIPEDVNDHINLEGGLDITLNCEVNQGDPAGITTPYRLLIPALQYDGFSDSQKLDAPGVQRKPTLLNKLGFGQASHQSMADRQGEGNWGQRMSESGSESGSIGEYSEGDDGYNHPKERRFRGGTGLKRWFSNRRRESKSSHPATYQDDQIQPSSYHDGLGQTQRGPAGDEFGAPGQPTPAQHHERQRSSQPQPYPAATAANYGGNNNNSYDARRSSGYNEPVRPKQGPIEPAAFPSQARGKAARMLGVDQGPSLPNAATFSSRSPHTDSTTPTTSSSSSTSSSSAGRGTGAGSRQRSSAAPASGTGRPTTTARNAFTSSQDNRGPRISTANCDGAYDDDSMDDDDDENVKYFSRAPSSTSPSGAQAGTRESRHQHQQHNRNGLNQNRTHQNQTQRHYGQPDAGHNDPSQANSRNDTYLGLGGDGSGGGGVRRSATNPAQQHPSSFNPGPAPVTIGHTNATPRPRRFSDIGPGPAPGYAMPGRDSNPEPERMGMMGSRAWSGNDDAKTRSNRGWLGGGRGDQSGDYDGVGGGAVGNKARKGSSGGTARPGRLLRMWF